MCGENNDNSNQQEQQNNINQIRQENRDQKHTVLRTRDPVEHMRRHNNISKPKPKHKKFNSLQLHKK